MLEVCESNPAKLDILGMSVTETDHLPALRSGMEMTGLIVIAVRMGCAADLAGVEIGDILFEVDRKPTSTLKDLEDFLVAHLPQIPISLLFRRGVMGVRFLALSFEENVFKEIQNQRC